MSRRARRRARTRDPQEALTELYESLPQMMCRGKCQAGCGSIGMTPVEQARIKDRHGVTLPLVATFAIGAPALTPLGLPGNRCSALDGAGHCRVYEDRPLVCRLWGMTPRLRCPWGCVPEGGMLSDDDARLKLARVEELAGNLNRAAQLRRAVS